MGGRHFLARFVLCAAIACFAGFLCAGKGHAGPFASYSEASASSVSGHHLLYKVSGTDAQSFIQDMANRAIDFLGNDGMSADQKKTAFRKLLQDNFDMRTIGRFSLGRYWRVSTPEQRNEYQKLFEQMVIGVYSERFAEYKGQRFETRGFREDGPKDTLVNSFIVPDQGPEIQVDWRVRNKDGIYKVVDVIVEGVSMSVTQRSDFSSVIQRGGGDVSVLLAHLREQ